MLTVIAEIRTRPGQHHRQAVLDQFAKIIPTVLQEAGCHGYAPLVDHAAWLSASRPQRPTLSSWSSSGKASRILKHTCKPRT